MNNPSENHWADVKERGSYFGMTAVFIIYKYLGKPLFYLALFPVISYFYLTGHEQRKAARAYQQRIAKQRHLLDMPPWQIKPFQQFLEFGRSTLDKIAVWMGKITINDVCFSDRQSMLDIVNSGKGGVILTSHLGNMEICRALCQEIPSLRVNALVHTRNAVKFNQLVRKISPDSDLNLIEVTELGPETAILLSEKIEQGEYVAIVGDRISITQQQRVIAAEFLGDEAFFPEGPFILASILKSPVFFMSCVREGEKYHVDFTPYREKLILNRKQRQTDLQRVVQDYAHWLEKKAISTPLQWFNFFDLWSNQFKDQ